MKHFAKIFKFEFNGYLRNKIFIGMTVFFVIAIAFVMFIPNLIAAFSSDEGGGTDPEGPRPVMLLSSEEEGLAEAVCPYFVSAFSDYQVKIVGTSVADVKAEVEKGEAECAFVLDGLNQFTYYVMNLSMYDMNTEIAAAAPAASPMPTQMGIALKLECAM